MPCTETVHVTSKNNDSHCKFRVRLTCIMKVRQTKRCNLATQCLISCKFGVRNQSYNESQRGIRTLYKTYTEALTMVTQYPYESVRRKVLGDTSWNHDSK